MQDNEGDVTTTALHFVEALYAAATGRSGYDEIFAPFDDHLNARARADKLTDPGWLDSLNRHFERAAEVYELSIQAHADSPAAFVERFRQPALIFDARLEILAQNAAFAALLDLKVGDRLSDAALGDDAGSTLAEAPELLDKTVDQRRLLIPVYLHDDAAPDLFIAERMLPRAYAKARTAEYVLICARTSWHPAIAELLSTAFQLTDAELDLTRRLLEGADLKQIAQSRGRSLRTVRTQMNSVLGKTQSQDQKRLVRLVAGLMQTGEVEPDHPDSGPRARRIASSAITRHKSRLASMKLNDGRRLAYAEYGDLEGETVLMLQPTTTPTQPEPVRKAMAQKGLHVIAPYRPGSGLSDTRSPKDGPQALAEDYVQLLDALEIEACTLVGHCSGGLYALAAAQRLGARARRAVMLDVGAPVVSVSELIRLPSAPRRTFLPARLFPQALIAPHRMVAADFNKDEAGEQRTVEYFFEGSPKEQERVRTDSYFYSVTRDNIAYSFENVPRLVEDVCRWVSNWESLITDAKLPVHFIHGSENTIFPVGKLEAFVRKHNHTTLTVVDGEGQLLLYAAPDQVAQAIAE